MLDPVYSGKAASALLQEMGEHKEQWQGRRVLFLHTGGLLCMYDKLPQLQPILQELGRSHRLDLS